MKKLKVLTICFMGRNRSKYLAGYLRRKGYSTRYGGLEYHEWKGITTKFVKEKDIEWADVIIIVRKRLKAVFDQKFGKVNKNIIILDVSDRKELVPKEFFHLTKLDDKEFNKKWTYPNLRKAIKPYLPLQ
jgi:predicted protein tyrosine phosphatase